MTAEHQNEESSQKDLDQRNLSIQGSADESTIVLGDLILNLLLCAQTLNYRASGR